MSGQISPGKRKAFVEVEARGMKLVFEFLVAVILHPVAVILMWINLAGREDLGTPKKVLWAILGLLWGIGPILYILVGEGTLW